jgi:pimeloyl-ACP methyl ester carboxylesterase
MIEMAQPIVICGGFLSFPAIYWGMRDTLAQIVEQPVWIVGIQGHDWMSSIVPPGWAYLLRKLERTVHEAVRDSTTGKITLVGHSAGGLLARLYLSPRPFLGHSYGGLNYVDRLITLGTPHHDRRKLRHGGWLPRWIEKRYPGAYFAPQVNYASVAGKLVRGDPHGTLRERHVYAFYKEVIGDGDVWGDGLVPVSSALLHGSHQVTLDGVSHFTGFGGPWYGVETIITRWWNACTNDQASGGNGDITGY